jgi:hypothetical protein
MAIQIDPIHDPELGLILIPRQKVSKNPMIDPFTIHKESSMTSFVHLDYTTDHPGVTRAERAFHAVKSLGTRLQGESGLATLLLTVAALSLVASIYEIIETSPEGQLLAAWVVFWVAGTALILGTRKYVVRMVQAWKLQEQDARMWEVAQADPRVMADIRCARGRAD